MGLGYPSPTGGATVRTILLNNGRKTSSAVWPVSGPRLTTKALSSLAVIVAARRPKRTLAATH